MKEFETIGSPDTPEADSDCSAEPATGQGGISRFFAYPFNEKLCEVVSGRVETQNSHTRVKGQSVRSPLESESERLVTALEDAFSRGQEDPHYWPNGYTPDENLVSRFSEVKCEWEALKKRSEDTLKIAIIGKFSSGKSSFINSIVGQEIAPVKLERTTRSNTSFIGAPENSRFVISEKVSGRKYKLDDYRDRITNSNGCPLEFEVRFPTPDFIGYEFIDTPGFDAADEGASECGMESDGGVSRKAAESADVLFFLFSQSDGRLGVQSVDYLTDWAGRHPRGRIYIVATKADKCPPSSWSRVSAQINKECEEASLRVAFFGQYCSVMSKPLHRELKEKLFIGIHTLDEDRRMVINARRNAVVEHCHQAAKTLADALVGEVRRTGLSASDNTGTSNEYVSSWVNGMCKYICGIADEKRNYIVVTHKMVGSWFLLPDDWCAFVKEPMFVFSDDDFREGLGRVQSGLNQQYPKYASVAAGLVKEIPDIIHSIFTDHIVCGYLDGWASWSHEKENEHLTFYAAHTKWAKVVRVESDCHKAARQLGEDFLDEFRSLVHSQLDWRIRYCMDRHAASRAEDVKNAVESWTERFSSQISLGF